MANPKKRKSKSRTRMGRSHHALTAVNVVDCPQCHEPKLPHTVCPNCGQYKGMDILKIKE